MDAHETVQHLASLMHLDIDAAEVYDEVLRHVTDEEIAASYRAFKGEHAHHATVLSDIIKDMGEQPPEPREDLMGRLAEIAMGVRSVTGDTGALHAMHAAERYHNSRYAEAQQWIIEDAAVKETLAGFYEEEKRHLAFIERRLGTAVSA
jgi:rubrerythrin